MSRAWPVAIDASAPLRRSGRSPFVARTSFIRHSVAVSTSAVLRPSGMIAVPVHACVDARAARRAELGAACAEAPAASALRHASSDAQNATLERVRALLARPGKCKNRCRLTRPACN